LHAQSIHGWLVAIGADDDFLERARRTRVM
jgi:hypothetical protein